VVSALILVIGPSVLDAARIQKFPAFAQFFWRRRLQVLGLIALAALLILFVQLSTGFGLEAAVAAKVDKNLAPELAAAKTPEEHEVVDIHRAVEMGPYNLSHTIWLRLALIGHVVLLVGIGLEYWLKRRGNRPLPRIEAHA
jgi:cytochrome b subunit of formate dehydrogenase